MTLLQRATDVRNPRSLSNRLRQRRFEMFTRLCDRLPRPLEIVDIGGTNAFWEARGWAGRRDVRITLVNLRAEPRRHANIVPLEGDATDLSGFADREFDVAFSNSVIEHLESLANQRRMADAVRRIARAHWVQTPNYWFPVEPHFHVPGWQWLPRECRIWLLQRRRCGWRGPVASREEDERHVNEVRLLTRAELERIFPGSTIVPERLAGVTKSWIVHAGFPGAAALSNARAAAEPALESVTTGAS